MIEIQIANRQDVLQFDPARLEACALKILQAEGPENCELSLAVVDDETIHQVNRDFLEHDYPTDVISFVLDQSDDTLEGEIVASAETAIAEAARYGWNPEDELLLYITHGTLHLVGYDDQTPEAKAEMRKRERHYLAEFGLTPPQIELESEPHNLHRPGDDPIVNAGATQR